METELNIRTEYWRKPIPTNKYDWEAWEDGKEESGPIGYGKTEDVAVEDLLKKIDERDDNYSRDFRIISQFER